jgi:putative oxidoreductase
MTNTIARASTAVLRLLTRYVWLGPLILRLLFGYFWLETGLGKLQNLDGFAQRFVGWGVPFPQLTAALSAGVDLFGGLFLILGFLTRCTAAAMAFNMIVAIALVVIKNVGSFDDLVEQDEFLYILIFIWLIFAGPGKASVDTWIAHRFGIATPVTRMSDEIARR